VAIKGFGALLLLAIGLPVVFLVACGSWHFVEKPILSLRKRFSFVARVRGVETDKNPAVPQPSLEEAFGKPAASHGAGLLEIVPFAESAKGSGV
jgi:peptidoglycan/LPS O-acetylase OafA/YrhL